MGRGISGHPGTIPSLQNLGKPTEESASVDSGLNVLS